ncbi:hypothetical protein NT6N_01250 [Oceaniferula spumae]|uniref:Dystroglycan-type cadherin-like domain-containing protein n=1 Tax=Oceaniferula spumae TaxID=2979115 RepID=A0AAT9FGH1_9BACT
MNETHLTGHHGDGNWLKLLLISMGLLVSLPLDIQAQNPKPNVLFIAIDDLVPTLGCYGDTTALTPKIDSLASQGLTFLNHHCTWSVCGPSRAALTTSLLPEETEVTGFKPIRDILRDVITLPQHFKNNGYETGCRGKFHDHRTVGDPNQPKDADGYFPNGDDIDDPQSWSIPYSKADTGVYNPPGKPAWDNADEPDASYTDHKILTAGLALVDQMAAGNKPFFLAVGFKKPHLAFIAPKRMWDLYDREEMPLASYTDLPIGVSARTSDPLTNNNEILGYEPFSNDNHLPTTEEQKDLIHGYYACTSWVDYLVGELLAKLATTDDPVQAGKKLSETTIIVLWGDHGFHLGDHGKWAKHTGMERGSSCPLIIYDPRSPNNGAKTMAPASTLDIYPTLCELAGLPIPSQPIDSSTPTGRPLRGRSLVPILVDPTTSVNTGAINVFNQGGNIGYSYRTERFRYIEWVNSSNEVTERDLYDYTLDPDERRNVVNDPDYAAIAYQLSRAMRADTTTQGCARLQDSSPINTGSDAYLPFSQIVANSPNEIQITWPGSTGVSYKITSSTDLTALPWASYAPTTDNLSGTTTTLPTLGDKRFFLIGFGTNTPPTWISDPLTKPLAVQNTSYSATLADSANDADSGDTLTFTKVSGPAWLNVASNGTLSGTPTTSDVTANYFVIRVTDSHGAFSNATLQISVLSSAPPTISTFEASDDTYAKENDPALIYGGQQSIQLKHDSGRRIGYLKFSVSGVGTVQTARLYLRATPSNDVGESDNVNALAVTNTTWTEGNLAWNGRPSTGAVIGTGTATPDAWFFIDVTSYIAGNGTFSIALDELGGSRGKIFSKEGGSAPYLEITWQ